MCWGPPCAASRASSGATSPPRTTAIPPRAASSSLQILAAWPGVQALLAHRLAHALCEHGSTGAARMLALVSRSITNIEIHPRAQIGDGLFIDHGTGVVIGETAEVGDNVTMYQGVTLGGTGFATGKRHPTVRGQRDDRLRRQAARPDHDRPRRPRSARTRS